MTKHDNSYRSILKGTSLFGGVQVFKILIDLLRGKFVAMFLGPEGMGVASLFNTASLTIQKFASLGLNLAIVKEVASENGDEESRKAAIGIGRRIIYATALAGALVCMLFSSLLSRLTFGNDDYSAQFIMLGVAVFFSIAGSGLLSILQGLHEVKRLSKASIVGGLTGLTIGVPLYYLFGNKGIVPAMVILAFAVFLFYLLSLRDALRTNNITDNFRFTWQTHKPVVIRLISLGLLLMASDLIGSGLNYLLNLFLRTLGNLDSVGLYQAANSLTNQYTGVVFTAMAMDYFPRLTAASADNKEMTAVVNRQLEIVTLIISPVIILFLLAAPLVVRILLTEKFMAIVPLIRWMAMGVFFKAIMFPLGYIAFAKGNKRVFFWLEGIVGNFLTYGMAAIGFYFFSLIGLGYGMLADCMICLVIYLIVNRRLYGYSMNPTVIGRSLIALAGAGSAFAISLCLEGTPAILLISALFIISAFFSFRKLRELLQR